MNIYTQSIDYVQRKIIVRTYQQHKLFLSTTYTVLYVSEFSLHKKLTHASNKAHYCFSMFRFSVNVFFFYCFDVLHGNELFVVYNNHVLKGFRLYVRKNGLTGND